MPGYAARGREGVATGKSHQNPADDSSDSRITLAEWMMLKQTNPSGWDFIHVSHKLKFLSPQTHPPFHSSTSLLRELSLLIPDFFVSIHTFQSDLVTAIPVEGNHRNKEPPGCIPSRSEHHLMATSHVGILCLQNTGSNVFISFPSAIPIKKH